MSSFPLTSMFWIIFGSQIIGPAYHRLDLGLPTLLNIVFQRGWPLYTYEISIYILIWPWEWKLNSKRLYCQGKPQWDPGRFINYDDRGNLYKKIPYIYRPTPTVYLSASLCKRWQVKIVTITVVTCTPHWDPGRFFPAQHTKATTNIGYRNLILS